MNGEMRLERVSGRTFRIRMERRTARTEAQPAAIVHPAPAVRFGAPSRFATGLQRRFGANGPEV